ncbi:hypothetical protein Poli38472_007925 [Pythium oligandrum]|uniref:Uncharacterized protein n=1 Tax=Pythium oligandrum TaxID=41045 RepID=A0A8K1CLS3_PYTOL|nr:hypothetical protein Poli38472_007925 [Pythium oligandrum]|eukprot:TMW65283.1 hypothetical protein Poli38472_007925 [Pythium oligandrum]
MSIIFFGQDPYKGLYQVPGKNDDHYADRSIVCARQGRLYRPIQLSEALAASTTVVIEKNVTAANVVNGYRVVTRNEVAFAAEAEMFYAKTCGVLALTLDGILSACRKLGYDIEEDSLRIVDGVDGEIIKLIPDSLPVLITPFWDNAFYAKYTVPVRNGSACSFRLVGVYDDEAYKFAYLRGVSRSVRENRTVELLGLYGGVWRNGWYEHAPSKTRWYSDVVSSNQNGRYGVPHRQFDTLTVDALETNCSISENCDGFRIVNWWGSDRAVSEVVQLFSSIVIMNGKRYGIFLYEGHRVQQVTSYYSLGEFISNLSLGLLLLRWMGAQLALLNSFPFNGGRVNTIGVGALSSAKSFHILPLLLLPRLKTMMAAFWTSGCYFEGQQRALGEAWSVIYPSIGETVLLFHSVLNLLAKVLRRRVSDV